MKKSKTFQAELDLGKTLSNLLKNEKIEEAYYFLKNIDPSKYHPQGMLGFLCYAGLPCKLKDTPAYNIFRKKYKQHLYTLPDWNKERIIKALEGL